MNWAIVNPFRWMAFGMLVFGFMGAGRYMRVHHADWFCQRFDHASNCANWRAERNLPKGFATDYRYGDRYKAP